MLEVMDIDGGVQQHVSYSCKGITDGQFEDQAVEDCDSREARAEIGVQSTTGVGNPRAG